MFIATPRHVGRGISDKIKRATLLLRLFGGYGGQAGSVDLASHQLARIDERC